jgi:osmotically-inducible protein OsmY
MADRYPDHGDYGRDKNRGRFSRDQRWSDDDDWRRRSRDRQGFSGREEDDDDRRGYGAYGGGYGQSMSGNYAGGYDRSREGDDEFEAGGGSYGGMRGQSYGGGGYRDRDEYDRSYGLQGPRYDRRGQSQYGGQGSQYGQGGYGGGQGGYSAQGGQRQREPGYRQQGFGGFGAYEEGGSLSQGRPGAGAQGYERTNQDYGGYAGSFGQGGSFGQSSGFGSEQSGSYLTRGGRSQWGRHSGRGPKNYTRSDDRIREDVNDRLTEDPELDASEIEVKVSSCEVTLTGTVDTREAKRRAEDCAESVSGVKHVQNNLRVQAAGEDESTRPATGGRKNKTGGDGEQRIQ